MANNRITTHLRTYDRGAFFVIEPEPMIKTYIAKKEALSALKSIKAKYHCIKQNVNSLYYLILVKNGDYYVEMRISNHGKPNQKIRGDPFTVRNGFLFSIDIHCWEALDYFITNYKKYLL